MKRKLISMALAIVMVLTLVPGAIPTAEAASQFDFPNQVANPLITPTVGKLPDDSAELPDVTGSGFLKKPSGDMPSVRPDGFLAEPTAPLPEVPAEGSLMEEPDAPDPEATPISTVEELQAMAGGGNYVLTRDIDLSGVEWTPIDLSDGYWGAHPVTLDGQGHAIKNLSLSATKAYGGLFSRVGDLTARNLILQDFSLEVGGPYYGALAGNVSGALTLENCVADNVYFAPSSAMTGTSLSYLGGFVGRMENSNGSHGLTLRSCAVTGTFDLEARESIPSYKSASSVGGFIGSASSAYGPADAEITDCISGVHILLPDGGSSSSASGFMAGLAANGTVTFLRCVMDGSIKGCLSGASGFASISGKLSTTDIQFTDCLFQGTLESTYEEHWERSFGGFCSSISGNSLSFENCRSEGTITTVLGSVGGLVGDVDVRNTNVTLSHCLAESAITVSQGTGAYIGVGGLIGHIDHPFQVEDCLAAGTIASTEDRTSALDMGGLVGNYSGSSETVETSFTRCEHTGSVSGTFSGGLLGISLRASGLPVRFTDCRASGDVSAFLETTSSSAVITAGGLLGSGFCAMENCVATGTVTAGVESHYVIKNIAAGGLLGRNYDSSSTTLYPGTVSFTDCRTTASLSAYYCGGLVGQVRKEASLSILRCAANLSTPKDASALTSFGSGFGGFVGIGPGDIRDSRARLTSLHGGSRIGAMAGEGVGTLSFTNCYVELDVTDDSDSSMTCAGLVAKAADLLVYNCAAQVDVEATKEDSSVSFAGLAGSADSANITHSYAVGTFDCTTSAGGSAAGLLGSSRILTLGQCWADVDIRVEALNTIGHGVSMYGLVSSSSGIATVYSCRASGTLDSRVGSGETTKSYVCSTIGGLLGSFSTLYMQDCVFDGTIVDANAKTNGGLVATCRAGSNLYNCYTEQNLIFDPHEAYQMNSDGYSGGLVGYISAINSSTVASSAITACRYSGTVSNPYGYAGGIAGSCTSGTSIASCETAGSVSGKMAGGIVGSINGTVADCTSSMQLGTSTSHLGGIVGQSTGTISNCHVTVPLTGFSCSSYVGGIAANHSGGSILDCSTKGLSGSAYTLGGILGSGGQHLENCRVDGSVSSPRSQSIGGLLGAHAGWNARVSCSNCVVNGDVSSGYYVSETSSVSIGAMAGECAVLTVEDCTFNGTLRYSAKRPTNATTYLGYGNLITDEVPEVTPPEEQKKINHTFIVLADEWGDITGGQYQPKEGVTVAIGGVPIGKTDKDGKVEFTNSALISTSDTVMRSVTANLDGYTEALRFMYMADGATTKLHISQLMPGTLQIKSAQYQEAGSQADLLSYLNDVRVPEIDDGFKKTYFEVEWNDSEPEMRTVFLTNEAGTTEHLVHDRESNYVQYAELFEPDEDIYVGARAFWKNPETGENEEVTVRKKLSIRVEEMDVDVRTPVYETDVSNGSGEENDGPYFLQGLKWSMGFNNIGPFAGEVSLKNNYLRLKFSGSAKKNYKIPLWGSANGSGGVSIGLEGDLSIPYVDTYTGEWSGKVKINLNDLPTVDLTETASVKYHYSTPNKSLFNLKYPFTIPVPFPPYTVPCFFDSKLDLGGTAELWITGPYDAVEVFGGSLNGAGYCEIFTGVGVEAADQAALKFGGEGRVNPKYTLTYSTAGDTETKSMAGDLSAKALIKAFDHSITAKLQLGTYLWDGEKTTWTAFGQEIGGNDGNFSGGGGDGSGGGGGGGRSIDLLSLNDADWQPLGRAYLAEGGDFRRGGLTLFGFSTDTSNLRYDNIAEISEAVLAVENGQLVLYFTADDGADGTSGTVGTHTALYRSVHSALGWSSPAAISTAGAYPDDLFADGAFAVWTESSDASSLAAVLTSTDVKAAISGASVQTFEGNGYVYAPKVSTDGTKALVTWLRDPSYTDAEAEQGALELWYATYDGSVWSEPAQAKLTGNPVSSQPDCAAGLIYYCTDQNARYSYKISSKSASQKDSGLTGRTVTLGGVTASFTENGALTIRMEGKGSVLQETDCITTQKPVLLQADDTYYLFWAESGGIRMMTGDTSNVWSQPVLAVPTEDLPEDLSAVVVEGVPYVSYYHRSPNEDGSQRTDLYTAKLDPAAVDLVLQSAGFEREDLLTTGILTLQGAVYNNGLAAAEGFTVSVQDADGKTVREKTFETAVPSGGLTRFTAAFVPSAEANAYTVTVTPTAVTDSDASDNALLLPFEDASAIIRDASFLQDGSNGVQLEAFVQNDGLVPLDLRVEITTAEGSLIQSYPVEEAVPRGSYRQFLLDNAQPDTYYRVTAYAGETELDSTMLRYEDPTAVALSVSDIAYEDGEAAVTLTGRNHESGVRRLALALYEGGRMAACGFADAAQLNGSQTLDFPLGKLADGRYDYKLFIFDDVDSEVPYMAAKTGSVTIGD